MNKILIIDDDKELCTLIKRSVLSEEIEADICNSGREGIQQLKEQTYQLVILDVLRHEKKASGTTSVKKSRSFSARAFRMAVAEAKLPFLPLL